MEKNQEKITTILRELMEAKRLDIGRLADLTDVPKRFVEALVKGNFKQLPAEPYVRGYLFKIAAVLDADPHLLWRQYRQMTDLPSSGLEDRLPANRFAIKRMNTRRLILVLAIIILLVFLGFRLNNILGKPTLDVSLPEITSSDTIKVTGRVNPGDRLTLNGEVVYSTEGGLFEKEVQLEPGLNTLEFRVKRYLGREAKITKEIFYQPSQ